MAATLLLSDALVSEAALRLADDDDQNPAALDTLSPHGGAARFIVDDVEVGTHHVVNNQHTVNVFVDNCVQSPLLVSLMYIPLRDGGRLPRINVIGGVPNIFFQSRSSAFLKELLNADVVRQLSTFVIRPLQLRWEPSRTGMQLTLSDRAGPNARSYRAAVVMARRFLALAKQVFADDVVELAPNDAELGQVMKLVTEKTSWLEGSLQRVGHGCEARLSLDEPAVNCVVQVAPLEDRWSVRIEGELGGTVPEPCSLRPQRGLSGVVAGLFDHKLGEHDVDGAFLIKGHSGTLALFAGDELLQCSDDRLHLWLQADKFIAELQPTTARCGDATGTLLSLWRRVARRAAGIDSRTMSRPNNGKGSL